MRVAAAFGLLAAGLLAACGPVPVEQAEKMCLREAELAAAQAREESASFVGRSLLGGTQGHALFAAGTRETPQVSLLLRVQAGGRAHVELDMQVAAT